MTKIYVFDIDETLLSVDSGIWYTRLLEGAHSNKTVTIPYGQSRNLLSNYEEVYPILPDTMRDNFHALLSHEDSKICVITKGSFMKEQLVKFFKRVYRLEISSKDISYFYNCLNCHSKENPESKKSFYLNKIYHAFKRAYPKLRKTDVILIDDSKDNIEDAASHGFSYLHADTRMQGGLLRDHQPTFALELGKIIVNNILAEGLNEDLYRQSDCGMMLLTTRTNAEVKITHANDSMLDVFKRKVYDTFGFFKHTTSDTSVEVQKNESNTERTLVI